MPIHPTAIVDRSAEVDASAEIGPYAIIEPGAVVGAGCRLFPHSYISTGTTLASDVQVYPGAVVGQPPQDRKWSADVRSFVRVGAGTLLREHVTIHRGTEPDSVTEVGADCFLMAGAHVGHNCRVADRVTMANGAVLGGHAVIGPDAFISGLSAVHQFVRIGERVMVGGTFRAVHDVPPFMMVIDNFVSGLNVVGLRRGGFSAEERREIRSCFQRLYRTTTTFTSAIEDVRGMVKTAAGKRLAEFFAGPSKRGYLPSLWRKRRQYGGGTPAEL